MNRQLLLRLSLFVLIPGLLLINPASPAAQTGETLFFEVQPGFDGYFKQNTWTPIVVRAVNTGPPVAGEIRLQTDYPGETYARQLTLPAQAQKRVTLFVPLRGGDVTVEFVTEAGQTLYRRKITPRSVSGYAYMVGVISVDPGLLNLLAGLQTANYAEPLTVVHLAPTDLPDRAAALAGLDALVFNNVDTGSLTAAQQAALSAWVRAGGKLVIGGGPNAALTAAGLADFLPDALTAVTLPTLVDLGRYVNKSVPEQGPYIAAVPQNSQGIIEIYEQDRPLLIRYPVGQGQVIYFALDFGLAPMNGWAGNEAFWRRALAPLKSNVPFYAQYDAPRTINDSLANISVAALPSPFYFLAFLCSYALFLVPLNYFVLKRLKKIEWAWLTIPALILLFTLFGYAAGFRNRGGTTILRQVSVIHQTAGESTAQVETFLGLYSPVRQRYTLQFPPDALVQPTDSGNGGFNGVKTATSAPTTIFYGNHTELRNLWTDIGGMSTVLVQHQAEQPPIDMQLAVVRQGADWRIVGKIINRTRRPVQQAALLRGNFGAQLPALPPGETAVDYPLQQLDTQVYNDVTLWGQAYYNIDDVQLQLNDRIIKNIFWSSDGPPRVAASFAPTPEADPGPIILVGWQFDAPSVTEIKTGGSRFDRQVTNLLIVNLPAREGQP